MYLEIDFSRCHFIIYTFVVRHSGNKKRVRERERSFSRVVCCTQSNSFLGILTLMLFHGGAHRPKPHTHTKCTQTINRTQTARIPPIFDRDFLICHIEIFIRHEQKCLQACAFNSFVRLILS